MATKEFDKGQLELAKSMSLFWEARLEFLGRAVRNGRCNECNEPLMFDEKITCEDCICPE